MTDPKPLTYARPNQCRFCTSRCCYHQIFSECGTIDEVSCARHTSALERHVDATMTRIPKLHSSGTAKVRRGGDTATRFREFRRELASLEAS